MANKEGKLIKLGTDLTGGGGRNYRVEEFLGGGGQGEVYRVSCAGNEYALKWYFSQCQTEDLKKSISHLISIGAPGGQFLWPRELIERDGQFGYIMGLRPSKYKNSQGILSREISLTYSKVCKACIGLIDGFGKLHTSGLSYQDISWGNIFIDPSDGDVLICDNDNVAAHGASIAGIAGTRGFMAPEIVRREAKPDIYTDMFSLGVLLFRILFMEHPLNGKRYLDIKCWDELAQKKLYGDEPVFIFDPNDDSNRPDPYEQSNANIFWELYPQYLKDLFVKLFTAGLTDRENERPREQKWLDAFRRLRESIFICECGAQVIYEADKAGSKKCWSKKCGRVLDVPPRLSLSLGKKTYDVVLTPESKLHAYHVNKNMSGRDREDADVVAGEVAQSPTDPQKYGVRNLTAENWHIVNDDGTEKDVPPNKSFALKEGLKLRLGDATGEIIL
ncbi:hypothetical protein AGMMS49975_24970 [Clostridia bacterium]|nr:hypothetical protein AGMMS49975_24970 [Clostridia bacterium]